MTSISWNVLPRSLGRKTALKEKKWTLNEPIVDFNLEGKYCKHHNVYPLKMPLEQHKKIMYISFYIKTSIVLNFKVLCIRVCFVWSDDKAQVSHSGYDHSGIRSTPVGCHCWFSQDELIIICLTLTSDHSDFDVLLYTFNLAVACNLWQHCNCLCNQVHNYPPDKLLCYYCFVWYIDKFCPLGEVVPPLSIKISRDCGFLTLPSMNIKQHYLQRIFGW